MSRTRAVVLIALCTLPHCGFFDFDRFRDEAPVHSIALPPEAPERAFGLALVTSRLAGGTVRIGLSGGAGETITVASIAPDARSLEAGTRYLCDGDAPCEAIAPDERVSGSIAAVARWNGRTGCVFTGAFGPAAHRVRGVCREPDAEGQLTIEAPDGSDRTGGFGAALASPRTVPTDGREHADVLFVSSSESQGRVFALTPSAVGEVPVPAMVSPSARFGRALVALWTTGTAEPLWLAVGAPGERSAYVFRARGPAGPFTLTACVRRLEAPEFGSVLALANESGSAPWLYASSAGNTEGRRDLVVLTRADSGCTGDGTSTVSTDVACTDVPERGIRCGTGEEGFGTALTAVDRDGDGHDEVLVGAPSARVDGTERAGAVWVLRGGERTEVLRRASPTERGFFGRTAGALPRGQRESALVGVAEEGVLFVFE